MEGQALQAHKEYETEPMPTTADYPQAQRHFLSCSMTHRGVERGERCLRLPGHPRPCYAEMCDKAFAFDAGGGTQRRKRRETYKFAQRRAQAT
jgi:hypothetical protein